MIGHRRLAAWYQQLAEYLDAGLMFAEAVRASQGTGMPATALDAIARKIEEGGTIHDAVRRARSWLPHPDMLALTAAAEAGRVPRTLRNLALRHAQIGTAQRRLVLACAYPLAILHIGFLLLPLVRMIDWERGFTWSTITYLQTLAFTLGPLWCLGVVLWILFRQQSPLLLWIGALLPVLRGYQRAQTMSDFSFSLGNFLEAGVPIGQAWATAGQITPSRRLKSAAVAMNAVVARGEAPGTKLDRWKCFPPDFVALYRTGEATGHLETNLLRAAAHQQAAAERALSVAAVIYPMFAFLAVAAGAAYLIFSIYRGYLKMLGKMGE